MTLEETIKINKKIMELIESKYPDNFPIGYTDTDHRYYQHLEDDVDKTEI